MVDLLKRSVAPITDEAWQQIDDTAVRVLKASLTGRTLVDFSGPHGWKLAGVSTGRMDVGKEPGPNGAPWGVRRSLPLIEVRIPFTLNQWELDNASRGAKDIDLDALEEAARNIALFEETAIYRGFTGGQIEGILQNTSQPPVLLADNVAQYPDAVAQAIKQLRLSGVGGPYALVLGPATFANLMQSNQGGIPPWQLIRDVLEGPILMSPALTGGVVASTRGGDLELIVGQDHAIGYEDHSRKEVHLFITVSFTFRVLMSSAAVELKAGP